MSASPLSFDGRVAIITGAGGGLGRSHALELARRGALVVVNDLGGAVDGTGGSTTAAAGRRAGDRGAGRRRRWPTPTRSPPPRAARPSCRRRSTRSASVDIIVNNAGILRDTSFKNMTAEMLDPVIDVHLRGAFNVTRPAWSLMRDQGYGRIINTTSGAGLFGNFGQANYGAAKMGLVGLARVLAVEGHKNGIRVNVIAPIARTRMTEEILGDKADQLDPELISPLVAYLAHESCDRNGAIYSVGGGRIARVFLGVTPGRRRPRASPPSPSPTPSTRSTTPTTSSSRPGSTTRSA